jgi:hypothetical protein
MNIDQLVEQYKSPEELKIYIGVQYKQILNLTKENKELKDKASSNSKASKELVKQGVMSIIPNDFSLLDDAKTISQIQLSLLKDFSFARELTTDEAKRVEIYNRIIKEDAVKNKPMKADIEVLNSQELLKLVE